ncbi:hypothetical protein GQ457_02G032660 [Hibiscus cannabinus]
MKAELELMRHEKIYMEASLTAAESALQEKRRVVSMYKAMEKLADDLLDVVIEAGGVDNGQELDEETIKELVEEAVRDFNEALKSAGNGISPADGGNGEGDDASSADGTNGSGAGGSPKLLPRHQHPSCQRYRSFLFVWCNSFLKLIQDVLKHMEAELEKMQEERKCMEAWLISTESALEEKKRMLSEYKAMLKLTHDLLAVLMEESPDNNGEEELVEEAVRDFTEALNKAQSPQISPYDGSSGDDHSGEAGGTDGGHSQLFMCFVLVNVVVCFEVQTCWILCVLSLNPD